MRATEHLRFAVRGFSAKRTGYLLVLINALLWPFHLWVDWRGDEYLTFAAFVCMVAALVLGFFVPRSDKNRFMPFALGLVATVIQWFSCKL